MYFTVEAGTFREVVRIYCDGKKNCNKLNYEYAGKFKSVKHVILLWHAL